MLDWIQIKSKSFKGLSEKNSSQGLSSKRQKGEGSSSEKFTHAEEDIIDEGYGSSLGRGGTRRSHPSPYETIKVGEGLPMEEGSSQVHHFDVKPLCGGLDCYVVYHLSLNILGLRDAHVLNF